MALCQAFSATKTGPERAWCSIRRSSGGLPRIYSSIAYSTLQMTRWSLLLLFLLVPLPQAMLGATGNIAVAELPDSLTIRAVELRPGERDTALAGPRSRESAPGAAADTQSLPEAVMEQHLQTLIAPVVEKVGVMGLCFAEHSRSICVSGVAKLQFR